MKKQLHVVKFGSGLVTNKDGINVEKIYAYADHLSRMVLNGEAVIVVTSGALAAGRQQATELGVHGLSQEIMSGMGFAQIFDTWQKAFWRNGIASATTGLTHHQLGAGKWYQRFANRSELRLFKGSLREANQAGVVVIINESDMISNTELMKLQTGGDNDGIAARIAVISGASRLTIFTEKGGVMDDSGRYIKEVNEGNRDTVIGMVSARDKSQSGRGGMSTKVEACLYAVNAGVEQVAISAISSGKATLNLTRFMVG